MSADLKGGGSSLVGCASGCRLIAAGLRSSSDAPVSQRVGRRRDGHSGAPRATEGAGRRLHRFPADQWAVTGRLGLTLAARNCRGGMTRMKLQTWAAPLSPAILERRITDVSNTGYSMGK